MEKTGFANKWTSLIMRCVSSVSYAVVVNGVPGTSFSPTRGLRQGGPLSPYLFILCSEALSSLIRKAKAEGSIQGIRVKRHALCISPISFADGSLLFFRASLRDADHFLRILRLYEDASGQKINFEKSEFSSSRNL